MKAEKLLLELEELCEKGGYTIRKEHGGFRGDQCVMEGEKLIVLNKNRPVESQAVILARVIRTLGEEEIFIKPAVRKELTEIWSRLEKFDKIETESDR